MKRVLLTFLIAVALPFLSVAQNGYKILSGGTRTTDDKLAYVVKNTGTGESGVLLVANGDSSFIGFDGYRTSIQNEFNFQGDSLRISSYDTISFSFGGMFPARLIGSFMTNEVSPDVFIGVNISRLELDFGGGFQSMTDVGLGIGYFDVGTGDFKAIDLSSEGIEMTTGSPFDPEMSFVMSEGGANFNLLASDATFEVKNIDGDYSAIWYDQADETVAFSDFLLALNKTDSTVYIDDGTFNLAFASMGFAIESRGVTNDSLLIRFFDAEGNIFQASSTEFTINRPTVVEGAPLSMNGLGGNASTFIADTVSGGGIEVRVYDQADDVVGFSVATEDNAVITDTYNIVMNTSGYIKYAPHTTAERDLLSVTGGEVIWNTTLSKLQVYNGSSWDSLH